MQLGRVADAVAQGLSGHPRRVVQTGPGRAHLGVRGMDGPAAARIAASLEDRLGRIKGVEWAAVNPVLVAGTTLQGLGQGPIGLVADLTH